MGDRCSKCGRVHTKCKAHNKQGNPCGMNPKTGADVCKKHGGAAPQVEAAAERRRNEELLRQAAAKWALPVDVGPGELMLQEVQRTGGIVYWLEAQIVRLTGESPDALWRGIKSQKRTDTQDGWSTTSEAGPAVHLYVSEFARERRHLRELCRDALALGIEAKWVQLEQDKAALVVNLLRAVLNDLNLSAEQQALVATVVPRHLRLIRSDAG